MITTLGNTWLADQINGRLQPPVTLMAIGTGTPGATTLGAEIAGTRHVVTPSSSGATATYKSHWDVQDQFTANITEVGLFNNANTLIASQVFTAVSKGINDPFNVVWNFNY